MKQEKLEKKSKRIFLLFLLTFFVFTAISVQHFSALAKPQQFSQKDLLDKKKKLQEEIEYKKKLLAEIKGNKNKSMIQLAIINNKIKDHEALIETLNSEISEISNQISETHSHITSKEEELKKLKQDYANMVVNAYKNRNAYDHLMFIFCANDFNQAYQRLKYFQVYTELRKKQAEEIERKKNELKKNLDGLEQKRSEQNNLLNDKETEKMNLSQEKDDKTQVLTELQQKESDVKEEIARKKKQADKIKKLIDKLIADEIKKQNEILKEKNRNKPKNNKEEPKKKKDNEELRIDLTPEEQLTSKNFEGNEGRLPWPVEKGVITERFGPHEHPDLPGIIVNCTGVEITSNKGAIARTVFDGEVVAISEIEGVEGKVVIIRHGEYLSVYYALENVYVQKGDKVKTKQEIGKVLTDENGKTELHLEIYKGKKLLNPEEWIVVKN